MPKSSRTPFVVAALAGMLAISLALAASLPSGRSSYRYLSVWQEVWRLTRANYVERVGEEQLLEGAYRGMLAYLAAGLALVALRGLPGGLFKDLKELEFLAPGIAIASAVALAALARRGRYGMAGAVLLAALLIGFGCWRSWSYFLAHSGLKAL